MQPNTDYKKNAHVGVILLYIRKDIPPMLVISDLSIEGFFVEVKSRKKKWLLCCSYNPSNNLTAIIT